MFPLTKDETGNKYGKLTVLGLAASRRHGRVTWRCACDCGGSKNVDGKALRSEAVESCGCLSAEASAKRRSLVKGQMFGRLRVTGYAGDGKWRCECACGSVSVVNTSNLTRGLSKSCGCLKVDSVRTHGRSRTREYRTWHAMLSRCTNSNHASYKHYGGRGIKVCERWRTFENFFSDVGVIPKGKSLDRTDVNGDYEPDNVRLVDWSTQARNKRSRRDVVFEAATITDLQIAIARKRGDGIFG